MNNLNQQDHNERVWRIKFSLLNSVNLYSKDNSVELIPVIDRLLLLFQKNVGLEIIKQGREEQIVFSFSERLGKATIISQFAQAKTTFLAGDLKLDKRTYKLYAYHLDANDEHISILDAVDQQNAAELVNLLNEGHDKLAVFLRQRLDIAFFDAVPQVKYKFRPLVIKDKLTKAVLEGSVVATQCKDAIRELLDDAFGSFFHNPLIYNNKFKIGTFFAVIRYPFERGNLPYSAQILLSGQQKQAIEDNLKQNRGLFPQDFSVAALEEPLEANSTSLADRCFSQDTVQFGLPYDSDNQKEDSGEDEKRRKLEDEFYKKLLDNRPPLNVFYVPIHVNGAAWIAVYRILPKEDLFENWFLNYEMYNQYTLLIAEKIRLKAKESIFKLLYNLIEQAAFGIKDTEDFIKSCEESMRILTYFFPYPVPFFNRSGIDLSLDEYLLNMNNGRFDLLANELWQGAVEHDKLSVDKIREQVIKICKQVGAVVKAYKVDGEIMDASYSISHLLRSRLDEPYNEIKAMVENLDYLNDKKNLGLDRALYRPRWERFGKASENLRDTLSILDLIPKSYVDVGKGYTYQAFLTKNILHQKGPLDILSLLIKEIHAKDTKRRKINIQNNVRRCTIEPLFLNKEGVPCTPGALLYSNCFLEAVLNFLETKQSDTLIISRCEDRHGEIGISLKNLAKSDQEVDHDFIEVSRKYGFHGLMGYLKTIFTKVGVGNIKKRVVVENGIKYFELGLFFKNINLEAI